MVGLIRPLRLRNFSYSVDGGPAYDIPASWQTKETRSMYKKILVPVDGSETSLLGLQHAILLAKDQKAALRLLHVVYDYLVTEGRYGLGGSAELLKDLRESGQTILKDAASSARIQGVEADIESVEAPLGPVGAAIA